MAQPVKATVLVGNGFDLSVGLEVSASEIVQSFADDNYDKDKGAFEPTPAGRLAEWFDSQNNDTWSDYEYMLGEYAEEASKQDDPDNEYLEAKRAFDQFVIRKVTAEEDRVGQSFFMANRPRFVKSLSNWPSLLQGDHAKSIASAFSESLDCHYAFVSFNYTTVLERFLHPKGSILAKLPDREDWLLSAVESFLYAHGKLHGSQDEVPICGVDNVNQIKSDRLRRNPRIENSFIKPRIQQLYGTDIENEVKQCINQADIVMIFGMSLGETDASWWKTIINWLNQPKKRYLIIFKKEVGEKKGVVVDYACFDVDEKEKLFESAGVRDKNLKERLEKRIFIVPSQGFLTIAAPLKSEEENNAKK